MDSPQTFSFLAKLSTSVDLNCSQSRSWRNHHELYHKSLLVWLFDDSCPVWFIALCGSYYFCSIEVFACQSLTAVTLSNYTASFLFSVCEYSTNILSVWQTPWIVHKKIHSCCKKIENIPMIFGNLYLFTKKFKWKYSQEEVYPLSLLHDYQ